MPQPTKIPRAFASSGDKNTIPDSTGSIGLASWSEGFPAITSTPFAQGGVAPKRADFNGIFNALSAAAVWHQQGGVYAYDNATNYEVGNLVIYSSEIYICKTANGPGSSLHSPANDSAETYWGRVYRQNGTFSRMFFSQTSGNYTAPYTGVYRITLKGGGGAGGYRNIGNTVTGGGGGEGATAIFYATLIKNTSYAYTIGAGALSGYAVDDGQGNISYVAPTDSGTTSISINNATFSAGGGKNAYIGNAVPQGGQGGNTFYLPGVAGHFILGCPGQNGFVVANTSVNEVGGSGGGNGGARSYTTGGGTINGQYGGGGAGMSFLSTQQTIDFYRGGNGGDGYILIEYAG